MPIVYYDFMGTFSIGYSLQTLCVLLLIWTLPNTCSYGVVVHVLTELILGLTGTFSDYLQGGISMLLTLWKEKIKKMSLVFLTAWLSWKAVIIKTLLVASPPHLSKWHIFSKNSLTTKYNMVLPNQNRWSISNPYFIYFVISILWIF